MVIAVIVEIVYSSKTGVSYSYLWEQTHTITAPVTRFTASRTLARKLAATKGALLDKFEINEITAFEGIGRENYIMKISFDSTMEAKSFELEKSP